MEVKFNEKSITIRSTTVNYGFWNFSKWDYWGFVYWKISNCYCKFKWKCNKSY